MNLRSRFFILVAAIFLLSGCSNAASIYKNTYVGFSIAYPSSYKTHEIKWQEEQEGIQLDRDSGSITVQAMGAGTMYEDMPFDEYVTIAASSEIQNFDKLVSIDEFVSDSGVKGYVTFWEVIETIPPDEYVEGMEPERHIEGPIYYFPPNKPVKFGSQPVKTIMLSRYVFDGKQDTLTDDLEKIAKSFKYLI